MTADNPFTSAREAAEVQTGDAQQRNRLWWERMPMTYVEWEAEKRLPTDPQYFRTLASHVLGESPFLTAWFAGRSFAGQRVLDIGCGSGVFSCLLARAAASVTAVDLSETAVGMARASSRAQKVPIAVARMDAEKIALKDGAVDFAFSWGVLHHTRDMDAAFREVRRVLKPGGQGMIMVYHRHSVVYYVHGLYWLLVRGKIFSGHNLETVQDFYTDGYYHRYLTRAEIARRLQAAGLQPTRLDVTQYRKKILPGIPAWLDKALKSRYGMCLVAEFARPAG